MGVRRATRSALAAAGVRPRRRLGQHFLCDPAVARRIAEAAAPLPEAVVLEIGPGLGALTDHLVRRTRRLYLVEVDAALTARLRARYEQEPSVEVVGGDALEIDLAAAVEERSVTVVGNLPFNIAGQVIFRLLAVRERFPRAVLMVQREVAERLAASPGQRPYGALSVLVQAYADVRLLFSVSRRSFLPPPHVDATVVEIDFSVLPRVGPEDADTFRRLVHAGFGQRRKMLHNALAAELGADRAAALVAAAGLPARARAEELAVEDFARLARLVATGGRALGDA